MPPATPPDVQLAILDALSRGQAPDEVAAANGVSTVTVARIRHQRCGPLDPATVFVDQTGKLYSVWETDRIDSALDVRTIAGRPDAAIVVSMGAWPKDRRGDHSFREAREHARSTAGYLTSQDHALLEEPLPLDDWRRVEAQLVADGTPAEYVAAARDVMVAGWGALTAVRRQMPDHPNHRNARVRLQRLLKRIGWPDDVRPAPTPFAVWLTENGLTVAEAAERLGVSRSTAHAMERGLYHVRGAVRPIELTTLDRLAMAAVSAGLAPWHKKETTDG